MTRAILTQADLAEMVADLVGAGTRVIAPVPVGPSWEHTEYRRVERLEEAVLDGGKPRRSLKEFFRSLPLDERERSVRQVIVGARPCDAAGLAILDDVMGWDYRDEVWLARRRATTVVTTACRDVESSCFCNAVGSGPASEKGADVLLLPVELEVPPPPPRRRIKEQLRQCVDMFLLDSQPFPGAVEAQSDGEQAAPPLAPMRWIARAITAKGEVLLRGRGVPVLPDELERARSIARGARESLEDNLVALELGQELARIDHDAEARLGILAADGGELLPAAAGAVSPAVTRIADWLARNPDHDLWGSPSAKCRGCGKCAAICSTSPCFEEIEGEASRLGGPGAVKLGVGASGAGPRRAERFRQRVVQKFSTYTLRFNGVQCTGCGRCSRSCEAGISLPAFLGHLVQLAAPEARTAR